MSSNAGRSRPVQQISEPSHFWIRYSPRNWRGCSSLWTNLSAAKLESFQRQRQVGFTELELGDLDGLVYMPPVDAELKTQRFEAVAEMREARVPVLLHARPGEEDLPSATCVVYDLLDPLVQGELDLLTSLPPGAVAAWPLIPGLTDPPELCEEGFEILSTVGVHCVQPLGVEISPLIRRRLAQDRDEDLFDALFHSEPISEREFSRRAIRSGLNPFFERPKISGTKKFVSNYKIASQLGMVAELWLRLDRSTVQGQALLRAMRGAETTHHHLAALVEEKNLNVLTWLDTYSHDLICEYITTGSIALRQELLEEYLGQRPSARKQDANDDEAHDSEDGPPDDYDGEDDDSEDDDD